MTTRTFLSPATRECVNYFMDWARRIGMTEVRLDAAGNFRAVREGKSERRLIIGSHLDTVPDAGAFDGVLGVVLGMAIAEAYREHPPQCTLEIVGFSEEEGVRFKRPFIGSIAFAQGLTDELLDMRDADGISVEEAISGFGLEASKERQMQDADGYLEFHIEQGPVLDSMHLPLAVVDSIAGQTRASLTFSGHANHAGTTPMNMRHDAFCAAAEWALRVEQRAKQTAGLMATVARVEVFPGVVNVVPAKATVYLDLRHGDDSFRLSAFDELLRDGQAIAKLRGITFEWKVLLDQAAVPLTVPAALEAVASTGISPHKMTSGAGHDAMILMKHVPSAMIFLRSPGGISHHPDERVLAEDVELALQAGHHFVEHFH